MPTRASKICATCYQSECKCKSRHKGSYATRYGTTQRLWDLLRETKCVKMHYARIV